MSENANHSIISAVIFDLDGVIIDSNPEIEKFWYEWADKERIELNDEIIRRHIHGRKGVETIENLFHTSTQVIKDEIVEAAIVFDTNMQPKAIEGVISFIQKLSSFNVKIGVVTSSHERRMAKMLNNHDVYNFFKHFITATDVQSGKPHPEPYLKMGEKLGIKAQNCLVFEDAVSGVQSAVAAGMQVIGVGNKQAVERLLNYGAVDVINNFYEIQVTSSNLSTINGYTVLIDPE